VTDGWSTTHVHPRDRAAYWVDHVCAVCQVDAEPRRGVRLFGEAAVGSLGGVLQIGTGTSTAQVLRRSARQIARGDDGLFHLILMSSGRSLVSQGEHETVVERGDLVLLDRARPYQFTLDGDFSQTVLMIPRESLLRRIGAAERFTAMKIDGGRGLGALLSPMLLNLAGQLPELGLDVHPRLAENVLDLIATALLSGHEERPVSAEMTFVRVKFWIEIHLAEALSGELIAAACGMSVRHLNRLFAREGTSLMRYVWERRLARCRRNLTDPKMSHRPIREIALAAGFRDLAHFSRAYRTRYGRAARDERNR
jgi:AraC family transcriptional regulator, positive regulator of tynA and feaB